MLDLIIRNKAPANRAAVSRHRGKGKSIGGGVLRRGGVVRGLAREGHRLGEYTFASSCLFCGVPSRGCIHLLFLVAYLLYLLVGVTFQPEVSALCVCGSCSLLATLLV